MIAKLTSLLLCLAGVLFVVGVATADEEQGVTQAGYRIIVYGATGRVGSRVVTEALNRGHFVTAVSRDPSRISRRHDHLIAVKGDVLDTDSVRELVADHDVVVVSVRGSADGSREPAQSIQRVAAEIVVNVLRDLGVDASRLIYVGGAGSLEVRPGVTYADTLGSFARAMMPASVEQEIDGHVLTLAFLRTVEDVRWTYISPAKKFGPGERTGVFRIGGDQMLLDEKGKSRISMEDFAVALVDEIESAQHTRERISVAY